MTGQNDQELLNAWLDGALGDEDAARLRERLATDAALRVQAEELQRLAGLVASLEPAEPPPAFADRVMEEVARSDAEPATRWERTRAALDQLLGRGPRHLQWERRSGAGVRWNTGTAGGGEIVAKKVLWACAGLALVIILGVVYFNGTRTVDQGAQGTIGGAERYRGAQPTNVTATEGDVQKFLQSDMFDRIIKDPHVLKLLENKDACLAMSSDKFSAMIRDDKARQVLTDDAVEGLLRSPEAKMAMTNEDMVAVFAKASLVNALRDEEVQNEVRKKKLLDALQNEDVAAVLTRSVVQEALAKLAEANLSKDAARVKAAQSELSTALKFAPDKVKRLIDNPEIQLSITKNQLSAKVFTDSNFLGAIRSVQCRSMILDPNFATALKVTEAPSVFINGNFQEMLKASVYQSFFQNPELYGALDNALFVEVLVNNAALKASLQNTEALNTALSLRKLR